METSGLAHLHLAIKLASDPISGSVAARGGQPRGFNGWIELVAAIEDARANVAAPTDARENPGVAPWGEA